MKKVVYVKRIVRIRIFERLSKRREGEIHSVLAEPDRDGFFVKVQDEQLTREANLVFTYIVGSEQGGRERGKSSDTLNRIVGDGFCGGEIGLRGGIGGNHIEGHISSWSLGAHQTR